MTMKKYMSNKRFRQLLSSAKEAVAISKGQKEAARRRVLKSASKSSD
jgi:hypothetical protein